MTRRTLGHYRIESRPIPNMNGLASKRWEAERTGTVAVVMPVTRHPRRRRQSPPRLRQNVRIARTTFFRS